VPGGPVAIGVPARLLPKPERDTRDRDLIGSLRDAGLLELAYGIVFAAATVLITL